MASKGDRISLFQGTLDLIDAKFCAVTKAGDCALSKETERWLRLTGLVDKPLLES